MTRRQHIDVRDSQRGGGLFCTHRTHQCMARNLYGWHGCALTSVSLTTCTVGIALPVISVGQRRPAAPHPGAAGDTRLAGGLGQAAAVRPSGAVRCRSLLHSIGMGRETYGS